MRPSGYDADEFHALLTSLPEDSMPPARPSTRSRRATPPALAWQLADASASGCAAALDALARVGQARREPVRRQTWILLDTFDERLADAGWRLEAWQRPRGGDIECCLRAADSVSGEGWRSSALPRSAHDLPDARLAARLASLCETRALLPRCTVPMTRHTVHWHDALHKRIGSVDVLRAGARGGLPARLFVVVRPVRGEAEACERLLGACAGVLVSATAVDPARVLRAERGGPVYRAKPVTELGREAPAAEALAALFAAYGEVLWANERGIVEDIDAEFLHDFRVALRSLRSWTGDLRKVMTKAARARVKQELATLNDATGRLRDLDVLAAALDGYLAEVGGIAPDAAARLADLVLTARKEAQHALARHLDSAAYRRFKRRWPRLCQQLAAGRHRGRDGDAPLLEVVTAALRRRRAAVIDFDWSHAEDEPAVLHELRKECKKLRYLLEGFQRLFDQGRVRRAIAELKLVQRAMGDTWDLHVHHALLEELTAALPAAEARAVLPVVIGLGTRLSALEHAHVELVSRAFARFRSTEVQRIYSRLIDRP